MGARVIDGRGLAVELKEELTAEVAGLRDAGVLPGLAIVLAGRLTRRGGGLREEGALAGDGAHGWYSKN